MGGVRCDLHDVVQALQCVQFLRRPGGERWKGCKDMQSLYLIRASNDSNHLSPGNRETSSRPLGQHSSGAVTRPHVSVSAQEAPARTQLTGLSLHPLPQRHLGRHMKVTRCLSTAAKQSRYCWSFFHHSTSAI